MCISNFFSIPIDFAGEERRPADVKMRPVAARPGLLHRGTAADLSGRIHLAAGFSVAGIFEDESCNPIDAI